MDPSGRVGELSPGRVVVVAIPLLNAESSCCGWVGSVKEVLDGVAVSVGVGVSAG